MFPRKLSTLSSEELGIDIQQNNASIVGHSSVEDAAAALRLYWHSNTEWERYLGYQILDTRQISQTWPPLKMYLDGCNLPIAMRGVKMKDLMGNNSAGEKITAIPSNSFQLNFAFNLNFYNFSVLKNIY